MSIIGVDIDNTCYNTTQAILSVYNEDSGDNLQLSDITEYYIEKFVKPELKQNFHKYFLDKRCWKQVQRLPQCKEVLTTLYSQGHRIIFITSTEPENLAKKRNWLVRNFEFFNPRKDLYCCPQKQLMSGIDVLIDDYHKNVNGGNYTGILLNYPWNIEEKVDNNVIRINNWQEILENQKIKEVLS